MVRICNNPRFINIFINRFIEDITIMQLKLLTLNIWRYESNWNERKERIIAFIRKEKPDIVFLQEVFDDMRHNEPGNHQALQLNKELKFKHCVTHVIEQVITEYGKVMTVPIFDSLACLTNLPVVHQHLHYLQKKLDDRHFRGMQEITLRVDGNEITFFHAHFSNRDDFARWHTEETFALACKQKKKPIIIGDLNVLKSSVLPEVCGSLYDCSYDVKQYISFPSKNETLDYVLIPRKSYKFKEIRGEGDNLSDHRALITVVEVA